MKVVRTVILSLILVFLAFVIYRAAKGGRKIPASTIRAEYRDIESKLTIPGVIQPSKEIDIKSTISGVLEKLLVQVGDEVVGGQPLAQIRYVKDPLEYRRLLKELEIAETRYLTAEASFERTENLYVKKLIAQEMYEGEKSNLAVLLSEYESVESELDMLKGQYNQKGISNIITATDAGTILELPIKEGGSVMARGTLNEGTTVARVADLQSLVFKGNVLESDILKLAVGMERNHSILRLDTHCSLTYLCAVIINDKDYGKRKSKLPGGVRPLSAVLRDQGPSGVLCGLWSELRQIHELAAPPAVERKAGEDGSGGTAQGSQGADNRQAQQQSYREDGSETAGR